MFLSEGMLTWIDQTWNGCLLTAGHVKEGHAVYMLAVCDDQPIHAGRIRKAVMAQLAQQNTPATVDTYTNPLDMKNRLLQGTGYDAYFLNIDMPGLDGISLCRCIRQTKGDALVVFIRLIRRVVDQNHGDLKIYEENGYFVIHIFLELENMSEDTQTERKESNEAAGL